MFYKVKGYDYQKDWKKAGKLVLRRHAVKKKDIGKPKECAGVSLCIIPLACRECLSKYKGR